MAGQTKFQARNREIHSDFDKIIKESTMIRIKECKDIREPNKVKSV